jgi:hypothetical protein
MIMNASSSVNIGEYRTNKMEPVPNLVYHRLVPLHIIVYYSRKHYAQRTPWVRDVSKLY